MNTERKSSCVKCQIIASNYFHIEWKHMFCCHPRHIKYSNFPVKNWVSFPGPFRTSWLVWCFSKTLLTFVYMCIYTHIAVLIYNSTFSFQYWLKKVNSIKGKKKEKERSAQATKPAHSRYSEKAAGFRAATLSVSSGFVPAIRGIAIHCFSFPGSVFTWKMWSPFFYLVFILQNQCKWTSNETDLHYTVNIKPNNLEVTEHTRWAKKPKPKTTRYKITCRVSTSRERNQHRKYTQPCNKN